MSQMRMAPGASRREDSQVAALMQQAAQAFQSGRPERLKKILEDVLDIDPDHPRALYNLGILCRDRNDIYGAEVNLRRAVKNDPELIDARQALGDLLYTVKHTLAAAQVYEEALKIAPNRLPILLNLARTRLMLKEAEATEALARRILKIDERSGDALADLAWALLYQSSGLSEALGAAERLLEVLPNSPHGLALKEQALARLGRVEEAGALWAQIFEMASREWEKTKPFNEVYYWLNMPERTRALTMAYIEANPERTDGFKDLAALLMGEGEFVRAQEVLDRAAIMAPDNLVIKMVQGLNAFRLGDYKLGLDLYGMRWHRDDFDKPWNVPVPEWDGRPIDGRLLVYCEQGIGDYVMYALLFPELRRFAKSIIIEVNTRIASLFRRSFPDMHIIDRNALPPNWDPKSCVAKVAMGDLPLRLDVDIENLPNRPGFLIPEPALAIKLRKRYQSLFPGKQLVGIAWRSGNRDSATIRSIDLSLWRPILETEDCAFISLQYGDIKRDIDALQSETGHVVHRDPEIDPTQYLDPFTAQIAAMDLVISVDNSTVHFAGGIGKPCWVMLPTNSDWRWLLGRSRSIWYDSLELFRQKPGEGWDQVVSAVSSRLRTIGRETLTDAHAEICRRCGEDLLRRGMMAPAEDYFRWLLESGRYQAAALYGIGLAARAAQHHQDAVAILGRSVELAPERTDYRADWAVSLYEAGHHHPALKLARELTRQGDDPTALAAMGKILAAEGHPDQATDYFARILRGKPDDVNARFILAQLQALEGHHDLARRNLERTICIAPDLAAPRTALAELDLREGEDERAWPNFAWRFGTAPEELPRHLAMIAPIERPKSWSGDRMRKRRLFLRAERNTLEQLLFVPFLKDVTKESRSLIAECDPVALPLLSSGFPKANFVAAGCLAPAALIESRSQIAASLGDLASVYPYPSVTPAWLAVDQDKVASMRGRLSDGDAGGALVGLSWCNANDRNPVPIDAFADLLSLPNVRWVSVQTGPASTILAQFAAQLGLTVIAADDADLLALAAWLAALDLVIAADDLVCILAGALGKPVWKIAGPADHWSWPVDGETSKWHHSAHIFRAPTERRAEIAIALRAALMERFPSAV